MQRKTNKILAVILSVLILASVFSTMSVFAKTIAEGTCGEDLTWVLDNEGRLTVNGNGSMYNYYDDVAPWYSLRKNIYYVVIKETVSSIGYNAFNDCSNLTNVIILNDNIYFSGDPFNGCGSNLLITGNAKKNSSLRIETFAINHGYHYDQHDHSFISKVTPATIISAGIKEDYCSACGYTEKVTITSKLPSKIAIEETTGVTVIYGIEAFNNDIDVITKENKDIVGFFGKLYARAFGTDITAKIFGVEVQPTEDIYIKLPVPYNYEMSKLAVYYFKNSSSQASRLDCSSEDNNICFFAPSFGTFLVVDEGTEQEIEDPQKTCTCKCHRSGFENFIWKIGNFFARLFGISSKQFCSCGKDHWA